MEDGEIPGQHPCRRQPPADRGDDLILRGEAATEGEGDAIAGDDMGHQRRAAPRAVDGGSHQRRRGIAAGSGRSADIKRDVRRGRLEDEGIGIAVVEEDRFHGAGCGGGGGADTGAR